MANVNIKFNNKDYLLSCDDGQEESLKKLTKFLDKKYSELKDKLGNIGENKLLLITTIQLIDEYFDFCFGELPYRSIKFHHKVLNKHKKTNNAVINFTDTKKFTRVTEWKNFPSHGENPLKTQLTLEEPCDYMENNHERYYPINDADGINRKKYREYSDIVPKNLTFIGRCGQYVYIDMDQAVSSSLSLSRKFIEKRNS